MKFRSQAEAKVYTHLTQNLSLNVLYRATTVPTGSGTTDLDFTVHPGTSEEFHYEIVGRPTIKKRLQLLALKKENPSLDIRLVLVKPTNPIRPNSAVTLSSWARAVGFRVEALSNFREEWTEE